MQLVYCMCDFLWFQLYCYYFTSEGNAGRETSVRASCAQQLYRLIAAATVPVNWALFRGVQGPVKVVWQVQGGRRQTSCLLRGHLPKSIHLQVICFWVPLMVHVVGLEMLGLGFGTWTPEKRAGSTLDFLWATPEGRIQKTNPHLLQELIQEEVTTSSFSPMPGGQ